MKIYTQTYDLATPSPQRFWVAPNSDFKFGVKILVNGETTDKDFTVKAGAVELEPDEDKIDGFTTYTVKSGGTGSVEYTIEVEGVAEKLKLTQITTDSTVFEVGGEGGGGSGGDATLSATTTFTDWVVTPSRWTTGSGTNYTFNAPQYGDFYYETEPRHGWYWENPDSIVVDLGSDDPTETSLSVTWEDQTTYSVVEISFSREAVAGFQLGDQSDKILADRNTVKNLVAGVVEDFGPWQVFAADGTAVRNGYVSWQPGGNTWVMFDGTGTTIGEASNGSLGNNLIYSEGSSNYYAYRRHTFTCPNGVEMQAAPSINGFNANIDIISIKDMVLLGLFNHYGANLYLSVD